MPDDKKHKRPEFKPPFPIPPLDDNAAPVLTNDHEPSEPVIVETVPETTAPLPPDDQPQPDSPPLAAPAPKNTTPKFVSKNATTLTRTSLSEVLEDSPTPKPTKEPVTPPAVPDTKMAATPVAGREPNHKASPPAPEIQSVKREARSSPSSSPSLFIVGLIIFSFIFGLSGWILYFNTKFGFLKIPALPAVEEVAQEATPTPQAPLPTPTPINNRKTITLEILNGSGVKGMAGTTADTLEKLGYTVLSTGNADKQDYAKTQILTSAKFVTAELLLSDLTNEFNSASVSGTLKDSTASARIIIGKDWTK